MQHKYALLFTPSFTSRSRRRCSLSCEYLDFETFEFTIFDSVLKTEVSKFNGTIKVIRCKACKALCKNSKKLKI